MFNTFFILSGGKKTKTDLNLLGKLNKVKSGGKLISVTLIYGQTQTIIMNTCLRIIYNIMVLNLF